MKEPPYHIDICWEYEKIFREIKPTTKDVIVFWKPLLNINDDSESNNETKMDSDGSNEAKIDYSNNCYMLGFIGLTHEMNPNDNIPSILGMYIFKCTRAFLI